MIVDVHQHLGFDCVFDEEQSEAELRGLADDICLYFGLGCRSVSKLYVPENYDFTPLFILLDAYKPIFDMHNAYLNNLDYQKTVHLINLIPFLDQGITLFKENSSFASAIGIVHYEQYKQNTEVWKGIDEQCDAIQCVISNHEKERSVRFGQSQLPEVWEYANKIDTMAFLIQNT